MPTLPKILMPAVTMPAAATATAAVSRRRIAAAGVGRGEDGKFLGQFRRAAMRAGCALPIRRANQDFAVASAFFAMEFVNRHNARIINAIRTSRREFFTMRQMVAVPADQSRVVGGSQKKFQRRRFDVAVAKDHVGFSLMP
jgi:hypothetical protein